MLGSKTLSMMKMAVQVIPNHGYDNHENVAPLAIHNSMVIRKTNKPIQIPMVTPQTLTIWLSVTHLP